MFSCAITLPTLPVDSVCRTGQSSFRLVVYKVAAAGC